MKVASSDVGDLAACVPFMSEEPSGQEAQNEQKLYQRIMGRNRRSWTETLTGENRPVGQFLDPEL